MILEAARRLSELERERDNCKREKEFAASDRSSCKKKHESRSTFLASSAATKRIGTNKQKPVFFHHSRSLSRFSTPRATHEKPSRALIEMLHWFSGGKKQKPALSDKGRSGRMVEANDTLEPVAALDDDDDDDVPEFPINGLPKTINDLPKELLVSVFIAFEDPILVMPRPLSLQGVG